MPSSENFDPGRIHTNNPTVFGIRITMQSEDTFANLIGEDWATVRWYASEPERNRVLATIGGRHLYSRIGDSPTLKYEAIEADSVHTPVLGQR